MKELFNPTSVAIVGVSKDSTKLGSVILNNLQKSQFEGKIYPINPKYDNLFNLPVHKSISSISDKIDVACIAIPASGVKDIIRECGEKGVRYAIVITAGFRETGDAGANLEKEILEEANKHNVQILGPNCLGLIVPESNLNLSFAASTPNHGNIVFMSQSGAFCTAILDMAEEVGLGFKSFISTGNSLNLNENHILDHYLENDDVKVIGAYLEEIHNGKALLEKVKKLQSKKPVIIFKSGKTTRSQQAISSHTGAIAGSIQPFRAAVDQSLILETRDIDNMFNTMMAFSWMNPPKGKRVAVVTNAGGPGIVATDIILEHGFEIAEIEENIKNKIKEVLPSTASVENPIDVIGDALAKRYELPLELLSQSEAVDAIMVIVTPQLVTQIEDTAKLIASFATKIKKPIFPVFLGGKYTKFGMQILYDNKVPVFKYIESAVKVMSQMYSYQQIKDNQDNHFYPQIITNNLDSGKYKSEVLPYLNNNRKESVLDDTLAAKLMEEVGISTVKQIRTDSEKTALKFAEQNYPVVIKAPNDVITHKTDIKAIYLNVETKEQVLSHVYTLKKLIYDNFQIENSDVIIQKQVTNFEEFFIGVHRDGNRQVYSDSGHGFGHLLVFGKGGIYTEIFKDVAYSIIPATPFEIMSALEKTKIYQILTGARGQDKLALEKVIAAIEAIQTLVLKYPEISSLDINPFLVTKTEALAVDTKIFIS